jgi:hypothetical protein
MAPQRCFRLITILLFASVTFLPAYSQDGQGQASFYSKSSSKKLTPP